MIMGKVTYHQQVTYCGKLRCRKCRDGVGHGPYWYAYQIINGRTIRTYIGKHLPADAVISREAMAEQQAGVQVVQLDEEAISNARKLPHTTNRVDGTTVSTIIGDDAMVYSPRGASTIATHSSANIHIWSLGQFRIEGRNRQNQQWQARTNTVWQRDRSIRALLGYLLCCTGRKASRVQLCVDLWPGQTVEVAQVQLQKQLQVLNKVLGPTAVEGEASDGSERIVLDKESVTLADQEHVWIDADAFVVQAQPLRNLPWWQASEQDTLRYETLLREALSLYSGDFLPEERDAAWIQSRRRSLQGLWLELHLELADLLVVRGASSSAIDILDKLLARDPTNEDALRRLMMVLAQSKRRVEALRAYKRFENMLQFEYDAAPSQETRALYEAVQQGQTLAGYISMFAPIDTDITSTTEMGQDSKTTHTVDRGNASSTAIPFKRTSKSPLPESIGRVHQSTLVGRASEIKTLQGLLREVEKAMASQLSGSQPLVNLPLDTQRRPQCLFLIGDWGIGKTRLAEEMSREAQQRGWSVVWSRLYTQELGVPYRVWTETIQKILNGRNGLSSALISDLLEPLAAFLPEQVETVALGTPTALLPPYALTPEQEKYRLWDAIGSVLKIASERGPLLIVLDDIQWADGSSHDLLAHLARNLIGYPILFVATCRDKELPENHPLHEYMRHMQREHTLKTLRIEPLSSEQIRQLAASLSPLPESSLQHIQRYADGNPFFAEELARSSPPVLPKTVKDALDHRMRRLSLECLQLLRHAAVLGGSFELQLILAMENDGGPDIEDSVLDLLEEGLKAGVLTDEGTGTRIAYHFWHPLLVSYLYDGVSATRRARLHQRAATALLDVWHGREESVAATVADHLEKAGAEAERIAHYAELAGNNAYALSAYAEAAYHYQHAVDSLQQVSSLESQQRLVVLLERLAECTMIQGNYAQARHLYQQVLDQRTQAAQSADITSAQEEASRSALLCIEIAWTWRYTGDNARAWKSCERAEQILREAGVEDGPAWARLSYTRSNLYQLEGRHELALEMAQKALLLFEQQRERSSITVTKVSRTYKTLTQRTLDGDPVNLGRLQRHMGVIAVDMGQLSVALEHQQKALALYEPYDEKRQIAHLSCNICYIQLKKGEYEQARAALQRSFELAEQISDSPLLSLVFSNQGELAAATGKFDEAEARFKQALELNARFQDREYLCRWSVRLATVLQQQGRLAEAARYLKSAWSTSRAMNNAPCRGQVLVALANLRIAQSLGAPIGSKQAMRFLDHAYQNVARALKLDRIDVETRMRGELTRAQVMLLQGKREKAEKILRHIVTQAKSYEMMPIVVFANELMTELI